MSTFLFQRGGVKTHTYRACFRCGLMSRNAVTDVHHECRACEFRRHNMDGKLKPNALELRQMHEDVVPWPQTLSRRPGGREAA